METRRQADKETKDKEKDKDKDDEGQGQIIHSTGKTRKSTIGSKKTIP